MIRKSNKKWFKHFKEKTQVQSIKYATKSTFFSTKSIFFSWQVTQAFSWALNFNNEVNVCQFVIQKALL